MVKNKEKKRGYIFIMAIAFFTFLFVVSLVQVINQQDQDTRSDAFDTVDDENVSEIVYQELIDINVYTVHYLTKGDGQDPDENLTQIYLKSNNENINFLSYELNIVYYHDYLSVSRENIAECDTFDDEIVTNTQQIDEEKTLITLALSNYEPIPLPDTNKMCVFDINYTRTELDIPNEKANDDIIYLYDEPESNFPNLISYEFVSAENPSSPQYYTKYPSIDASMSFPFERFLSTTPTNTEPSVTSTNTPTQTPTNTEPSVTSTNTPTQTPTNSPRDEVTTTNEAPTVSVQPTITTSPASTTPSEDANEESRDSEATAQEVNQEPMAQNQPSGNEETQTSETTPEVTVTPHNDQRLPSPLADEPTPNEEDNTQTDLSPTINPNVTVFEPESTIEESSSVVNEAETGLSERNIVLWVAILLGSLIAIIISLIILIKLR